MVSMRDIVLDVQRKARMALINSPWRVYWTRCEHPTAQQLNRPTTRITWKATGLKRPGWAVVVMGGALMKRGNACATRAYERMSRLCVPSDYLASIVRQEASVLWKRKRRERKGEGERPFLSDVFATYNQVGKNKINKLRETQYRMFRMTWQKVVH